MSIVCYKSGLLLGESGFSVTCLSVKNCFSAQKNKFKGGKKLFRTIKGFSGVATDAVNGSQCLKRKHVNTALSASNIIQEPQAACSDGEKTVYFHVLCTFELFLQDQDGTSSLLK